MIVRSYRTFSPLPTLHRRLFSVALFRGLRDESLHPPGFPRYPIRLESGLSSLLRIKLRRAIVPIPHRKNFIMNGVISIVAQIFLIVKQDQQSMPVKRSVKTMTMTD